MSASSKGHGGRDVRALLHRSFTWKACLRFAGSLAILAVVNLMLPSHIGSAVQNPMGAAAVIAVGLGVSRVRTKRAWNAIAAGVIPYALGDVVGAVLPVGATPIGFALLTSLLYLASYALLAAGLTFMLVERRTLAHWTNGSGDLA